MISIAPQDIWRSEAFAEDLFDDNTLGNTQGTKPMLPQQRVSTTLLCALPVAVALLGGAMAFFHTIG